MANSRCYVLLRRILIFKVYIHVHIRFSGGLLTQICTGEFIYQFSEEQMQGGGDARLIFDTGTTVTYVVSHVYNALKIHVSSEISDTTTQGLDFKAQCLNSFNHGIFK